MGRQAGRGTPAVSRRYVQWTRSVPGLPHRGWYVGKACQLRGGGEMRGGDEEVSERDIIKRPTMCCERHQRLDQQTNSRYCLELYLRRENQAYPLPTLPCSNWVDLPSPCRVQSTNDHSACRRIVSLLRKGFSLVSCSLFCHLRLVVVISFSYQLD